MVGVEIVDTTSSDDDPVEVDWGLGDDGVSSVSPNAETTSVLNCRELGEGSRSEVVVTPRRSPRLLNKSVDVPVVGEVGSSPRRSPRLSEKDVGEPAVGMVFDTQEDVEVFYQRSRFGRS